MPRSIRVRWWPAPGSRRSSAGVSEIHHRMAGPPWSNRAMIVRSEEPADHGRIRTVHAVSFPTLTEARLVDALRAAGGLWISLVAEEQREIVGHIAFSPVNVLGTTEGVGLAPVAVLPPFRRRGIAGKLIRAGLAACGNFNHGFVVVLGEPSYYRRFGFLPASNWGLRDQYGGGDAFQALELQPAAIPAAGGVVHYAPEFDAVGGEATGG